MNLKDLKITKFQYTLLFLLLFFWLYIRSGREELISAVQTQYLFNYEFEFLKRALIGEILRLSVEDLNGDIIRNISLIFQIVLSLVFYKIFFINFNKQTNINKLIFSLMIFVSPLTLQHFLDDIGRFDIINLLITLLVFLIIDVFYKNTLIVILLIFPLIICMLLIHEGSFLMFVPMIFGYWFFKNSKKSTFLIQFFLFLFILFITYKISTLGLCKEFTYSEYYNYLINKYLISDGNSIHRILSVRTVTLHGLFRDFLNTYDPDIPYAIFEDTLKIGFSFKSIINNLILITLLSPVFFIVFTIYRSFFKVADIQTKLFLISPFSGFVLFILGYDHMRWWALIFTNIFIIILKLNEEKNIYREILLENIKKYKNIYIFLIVESFIVGPVSFMHTFDIIQSLNLYRDLTLNNPY